MWPLKVLRIQDCVFRYLVLCDQLSKTERYNPKNLVGCHLESGDAAAMGMKKRTMELIDCYKSHLLALQSYNESQKIENGELKERLVRFHKSQIESSLEYLKENEFER